jgi:hypothetical protein
MLSRKEAAWRLLATPPRLFLRIAPASLLPLKGAAKYFS